MALILAALARPAGPLHADQSPNAGYSLDWWIMDDGGQSGPAGQGYTLESTIGQPDAALWRGGTYELAGGLWSSGAAVAPEQYRVYLPLVSRYRQLGRRLPIKQHGRGVSLPRRD